MDVLISLKRRLDGTVSLVGLRPFARSIFRRLVQLRYGADGLALSRQNGRTWKLHHRIALAGNNYELQTIEWLRATVKPGDCVIDVGANVGQLTLEAAYLAGPNGKVIAVEPAPGNAKVLRTHVSANGFGDRVEIIEAACGATNGEVTLHVYGDAADSVGAGHNIIRQRLEFGDWRSIQVPMYSIDQLCQDKSLRPSTLKIDVEGAELEVLQGSVETLRSCRPQIQFAFHPFAFADPTMVSNEIISLLERCGYKEPQPSIEGAFQLAEYTTGPIEYNTAASES